MILIKNNRYFSLLVMLYEQYDKPVFVRVVQCQL